MLEAARVAARAEGGQVPVGEPGGLGEGGEEDTLNGGDKWSADLQRDERGAPVTAAEDQGARKAEEDAQQAATTKDSDEATRLWWTGWRPSLPRRGEL